MKKVFIRKYWEEEDILYYLHFENQDAVRQIEISKGEKKCFSIKNPNQTDVIYDQNLDELDLNEEDFISEEEFNKAWKE